MEYKVIVEPLLADLESAVNAGIKEGWAPCGGIATDPVSGDYLQAVVRMPRPQQQQVQPVRIVAPNEPMVSHTSGKIRP